jgi:hypothetical protein
MSLRLESTKTVLVVVPVALVPVAQDGGTNSGCAIPNHPYTPDWNVIYGINKHMCNPLFITMFIALATSAAVAAPVHF